MDDKFEAKKRAQDFIENRMRGKFIGCQYVICVTLKNGDTFTNLDFFQGKATVNPEDVAVRIEIVDTGDTDYLVAKMYNTTSFIRISDDAREDYQSRMISNIDKNWKAVDSMEKSFYIINNLKEVERSILIMHGIVGFEFVEIAERGAMEKTQQRNYCRALKNFDFVQQMIE